MVVVAPGTAHRRQFVVGPAPFDGVPDWQHLRLAGHWLSHCPTLPVAVVSDAEGSPWALVGRAVESCEECSSPDNRIAAARTHEVPSSYDGWAGRWLLVGAGELHLDATGLLGCYVGRASDGAVWASSSPILAARLASGVADPPLDPWPLRYEDAVSWVVPPRSRYASVRRLLPSQVLVLADGSVRTRPLLARVEREHAFDETLGLLESALATALRRLSVLGPVWLGLTAGADSRVVLATAHAVGAEVGTFTRCAARASVADRVMPPQLAALVGVEHRYLRGTRRRDGRSLVAEHTGGHVGAGDAEPFLSGERGGLDGFCVGGWGMAVGRDFRELPDRGSTPEADAARIARLLAVPRSRGAHAALGEWLAWVGETPEAGLALRDRFTIEQRQAGWLAAKEQLYDLDPVERVVLVNARRFYALLLSLSEEVRVSRVWQYDLVLRSAPELAVHPYNPPDRHFGLARAAERRLRHPLASVRRLGRRARRVVDALAAGTM